MSYRLKLFKNKIQEKIKITWQYIKACSYYLKADKKQFFSIILQIFKAHLKHDISPLLYSFYRLEAIPESKWGEYIVDQNKFNQILAGDSTIESRRKVGNKLRFYQHCISKNLPIIPVYCVFAKNKDLKIDTIETVYSLNKWREIISKAPNELFIKPILGARGKGTFGVSKEGNRLHFSGRTASVEDLYYYLMKKVNSGQSFIIQPRMKTHSSLMGIVSPQGLSTARVITIRGNGKPQIVRACLKIIRGNNEHDNFLKGMSKNLIASINIDSGELNQAWGSLRTDWPQMVQHAYHPDTGEQIKGTILPFWRDVSKLALRAQKSVPFLPTIGWDIAITEDGIFIVEANAAYGVTAFQLFENRGLRKEFERLLKG